MHKNRQNSVDSINDICFHVGMDARPMKKQIPMIDRIIAQVELAYIRQTTQAEFDEWSEVLDHLIRRKEKSE